MKIVLLIIAILIVLGLFGACAVLISMGIGSRELWEMRNLMEKENENMQKEKIKLK